MIDVRRDVSWQLCFQRLLLELCMFECAEVAKKTLVPFGLSRKSPQGCLLDPFYSIDDHLSTLLVMMLRVHVPGLTLNPLQ